ncbi:phosphoribosylformylglycinamidine synthase subunit PurL [Kouleothrix sp.]|uniref:phosphoribosylformylglycinamidine synthase subunit PurL n=1 Tax=Kouleothrix sp. TaxID=2779161 RepID=UPI00391BC71E
MGQYLVSVRARHGAGAPQHLYLLDGELADSDVARLARELLHDAVVQQAEWCRLADLAEAAPGAEVAFKPGVTDNEAESVLIGARRLGVGGLRTVRTLRRFPLGAGEPAALAGLYNPLIQTVLAPEPGPAARAARQAFYADLLRPPAEAAPQIARVPLLAAGDEELAQISREGVLSLDLAEMRAIQAYFRAEERAPTDGELETLAQTWSEHCSHKTFKARVHYRNHEPPAESRAQPLDERYAAYRMLGADCEIDSLIRTFLIAATDRVLAQNERQSGQLSVLSAFVDNAGILAFGEAHEVSIKVETHNHPSALEPFGGANTGVGGVVRDVLGVSALPIANTDVLCFGPLGTPEGAVAPGVLHPRRVAAGVVAGVRDYGNKLGIPTVNGAVLYDQGYIATPLVFCGTVGLAPRGSNPHNLQPGDAIVVLGGRTGRDGIHGATFSSAELTHTTAEDVGSAVQIGDPITEKKVLDVLLQARDAGLYSAITDCGAGGLSSAVGELGADTGARVSLDDVTLKYAGLQPWEIWLSEAQERMVLAVPPQHLGALLALCAAEDVEATVIGQFTDDGRLTVTHRGERVVDLSMRFLHKGIPQRVLDALWTTVREPGARGQEPGDSAGLRLSAAGSSPENFGEALKALLAHPNIASKAPIVRTYDHEVRGGTVVKPLVGARCDGPGDAAVLQPLRADTAGVALGCGINPRYGAIDPYWMALACVDEALRNVVAVGGDPARAAILDNFCWGDPRQPDRMAGLVRAAAGCHDAALAYGAPFVSGKDSLNNEYRGADGQRTPIPPTLLITALAHVPDVRQAVTMDLKLPDSYVYLLGETRDELAGAHILDVETGIWGASDRESAVPMVDLATAPRLLAALHGAIRGGLVRACHDLSEGGLGVAAAEMAFAGEVGLRLDLRAVPRPAGLHDDATILFGESPTRLLAEVRPGDAAAFEAALAGLPCARVGATTAAAELVIAGVAGGELLRAPLAELKAAWQGTAVV